MSKKSYSIEDILNLDHNKMFLREKLEELWSEKKDLTINEILDLSISMSDKMEFVRITESTIQFEFDLQTLWFENGKFHRDDGPALEFYNGTKYWFHHGERHREDGPAIEFSNGSGHWYQNGKLHRDDGPAMEYPNGIKCWYQKGQLHREDGPAVERADGSFEYWEHGKRIQ